MTLGDRRKSYKLDKKHVKDISVHQRRRGRGSVSEDNLPSFVVKGKEGEIIFRQESVDVTLE